MHHPSDAPTTSVQTALITGATSGLGLELAKSLLDHSNAHLVLPVRNAERGQALRTALGRRSQSRLSTPLMDLGSLSSVQIGAAAIIQSLRHPLDAVMLNAGVQSANRLLYTDDQLEQTFAVNHLAHHLLLRALEPRLAGSATVGWVGSGTHLPDGAKTFGYTGAHYLAADLLSKGRYPSRGAQASRDAYSTSKGLNIVSARHWARLMAQAHPGRRFFALDPGLMPGTGLAREGSAVQRFGWNYILPLAARVMKRTSTPQRSAMMLAEILLRRRSIANGDYVEFTGHILAPFLPPDEHRYAEALFAFSDRAEAPVTP
ncbi:MAG: hypothetical protein RLZZ126_428 [Pseudomonadota bacterium]|jgi:NAD(P)-dependent dehydrogenase (short-subunit alcohol dehydrogenase family)